MDEKPTTFKDKLAKFFEECAAMSQEERKKYQTIVGLICGILLLATITVSLFIQEGIWSFSYFIIILAVFIGKHYFEKNTGWNLRYMMKLLLIIAGIGLVCILLYGIATGVAFTN